MREPRLTERVETNVPHAAADEWWRICIYADGIKLYESEKLDSFHGAMRAGDVWARVMLPGKWIHHESMVTGVDRCLV